MTKTYIGSSKNVILRDELHGEFEFTDRYSIFDWGEMPDLLSGKGEALALMAKIFFDELARRDVRHHAGDLLGKNRLAIRPVQVLWPHKQGNSFDYSAYQDKPKNALVPLEVIFRLGAPKGSSILARRPDLKENARFDKPIIEFTTKLEDEDRALTWDEAATIAALTSGELQQLADLTAQVAFELSAMLEKVGVELWDGKLEWAWDESRSFLLVDAIGLDELRVSYRGLPLSKEFLRQHYRSTPWFADLTRAKAEALKTGADFKEICLREFSSAPAPLPVGVKHSAQLLYTAFANDLCALYRRERPWGEHVTLRTWQESLS